MQISWYYNPITNYFTWFMQFEFLLSIYFRWYVTFVNCYEKILTDAVQGVFRSHIFELFLDPLHCLFLYRHLYDKSQMYFLFFSNEKTKIIVVSTIVHLCCNIYERQCSKDIWQNLNKKWIDSNCFFFVTDQLLTWKMSVWIVLESNDGASGFIAFTFRKST